MMNAIISRRFLPLFIIFSVVFGSVVRAHEGHGDDTNNTTHVDHDHAGDHEKESHSGDDHGGEKFDVVGMIMHHIKDAHEWHFWGEGENSVGIPLPVIVYSSEHGLATFMSSAFHHDDAGKVAVEANGAKYFKFHEKIYLANENGELSFDDHHHPLNATPLDFSITKNVVALWISAFLLIVLFVGAAHSYNAQGVPSGIGKFLEPLVLFVKDDIAIPNIGEKHYARFMPYLLTVFFFIWINNLLGLIPFFPGGANLTGNIAFTLTLSVITFLLTNLNGNKDYWIHIIWMPGVPVPVKILMFFLEVIGLFTKPFALMIRLFANITAGHILILSLVSLIFIGGSVAWAGVSIPFMIFMNCLELLVAALQAYIFTLLSALFIGMAVAEHDHDHEHGHAHESDKLETVA